MEKFVLYIALIIFSWFLSGCGKCKDLTYYGYLPQMEKYFGMYVPDNWWVYYNQDSTKKDSIYVTDFKETIDTDTKDNCIEYPTRDFILNTDFLVDTNSPISGTFNNNSSCCINYFSVGNHDGGITAIMDSNFDSFPRSNTPIPETFISNLHINGMNFSEVILFENGSVKIYFAPFIGIVQYLNLPDTFFIDKYYIK